MIDWEEYQPYRCYFYPGRDCPGWVAGGTCARFDDGPLAGHYRIPQDETGEPEPGPWAGPWGAGLDRKLARHGEV